MGAPADSRFQLAWGLLDQADALSVSLFESRSFRRWTKPDGTPATDVDLRIERQMTQSIREAFPQDLIVGEELGKTSGDAGSWLIDPIDGTINFVDGVPAYAQMVAYRLQGETVFSLVSAPMLRRRWWAHRDGGAFEGSRKLSVSPTGSLAHASVCYGGLTDYTERQLDGFVRLVRRCRRSRGFGNFWSHMLVAEGVFDIASTAPGCRAWDVRPLEIIVREAGGLMTSFRGTAWEHNEEPLLSSNRALHPAAVAVLSDRDAALPVEA